MSSASTTMPAEAGLQLSDVARIARSRSAIIRNVALAVVAVTFVVLMLLPTMYATSASVMIDPRKNNVTDLSAVLSQLPTDPASLQNQVQILTSRDLAQKVIDRLRLYDDPDFNASLNQSVIGKILNTLDPRNWLRDSNASDLDAQRDKIIDAFEHNLTVAPEGLSTTLTVTFTARDPAKAALIANTLVDTYIESQIDSKRSTGDKTTAWLLNRTNAVGTAGPRRRGGPFNNTKPSTIWTKRQTAPPSRINRSRRFPTSSCWQKPILRKSRRPTIACRRSPGQATRQISPKSSPLR